MYKRQFVPDEDDVVVERITAAGAIVIGKTQVPEFGYSGTWVLPITIAPAAVIRSTTTSSSSGTKSA